MQAHSLLPLLPTASISPRTCRSKHPNHSSHFHHLLPPIPKTLIPPPLHASSPSADPSPADDLHLLDKPSPSPSAAPPPPPPPPDEVLAPFLKFFEASNGEVGYAEETTEAAERGGEVSGTGEGGSRYYDPRPGDLVVGVVASGDERTLDVNIGAAGEPALMLAKDVLPLCGEELAYLSCDVAKDTGEFAVAGKVGVVRGAEEVAVGGGGRKGKGRLGRARPLMGVGTVVFAEVIGRTLGGRPLLSSRRLYWRIAWHRARQIKQLNMPIEVKIFGWNAGGLLSRIEGLRAFLPKAEMMARPSNFTELKNNVGRRVRILITRIDEGTKELVISEKEAWGMIYLREGTLLQGTVQKLLPYGAQIKIGETNRRGLLHISNISHDHVTSINGVLNVDEKVKVLVVKSPVPDRIALSTRELESEPGLFLSNKEKVFSEAEELAQKYRERIPEICGTNELDSFSNDLLPFDNEASMYANWEWFKFKKSKVNSSSSSESR